MRSIAAALSISAAAAASPVLAQSTDVRAVTTYQSAGLYWSNLDAVAECDVRFRKAGSPAWIAGLPMWYDARNRECRGSVVNLDAGTNYEAELSVPGQTRSITFTTWPDQRPIARTIVVPSGSATLSIDTGGTADGYVVYQAAPGAVLDAANASPFNITVNAPYVIVRGFVLRGAQQDAIRIAGNLTDVIIEDNDISGWGRLRTGTWGMDMDSGVRAVCASPLLERVTIQRNRIHDPRYGANSWSDGHPQGPQAITFSFCGGNHVIRHNEIWSSAGHYFNDGIGGEDNFTTTGFPNYDSDIYGNIVENAWDDAIEAEGGDRNVRIWGNYMDNTATGAATTVASIGPVYLFRNVYNRSRLYEKLPLDQDDRQEPFKAGSDSSLGDGRRYVFHNTMLQAIDPSAVYPLGGGRGLSGSGATQPVNNTVSMNNIYHIWRTDDPYITYRQVGSGNDFENDMFNGTAGAPVVNGIHAAPTYAPGNGWVSESGGRYALAAGTPGYDGGIRIANFNDDFLGAAPDVGAHEAGSPPMRFGLAASPGSSIAPRASIAHRFDFNADARDDLVWRNTSDGSLLQWLMNGTAVLQQTSLGGPGTTDQPIHIADFNGDGKADIVWQDSDGTVSMTLFDGANVISDSVLVGPGTGWRVTQVADLDGDGKSDLIWTHTSGAVQAWLMNGASATAVASFVGAGSGWSVTKVADLDGDGRSDILWQHTDGTVVAWLMNGLNVSAIASFASAGSGWGVSLAGDLDGDGKDDLVWTHTSGAAQAWLMNGLSATQIASLAPSGAGWSPTHVGDLDGDGRADLLWRHADGTVLAWLMGPNLTVSQVASFAGSGNTWSITHLRDLDGDGKQDILWRAPDGTVQAWIMNGLVPTTVGQVAGPGPYEVVPPNP